MKQILIQAAGHALFAAALFATSSAALAQSAQDFVNKVAISDMFEIQSSQLALSKQADEDTKPFAQKMVQETRPCSASAVGASGGSVAVRGGRTARGKDSQGWSVAQPWIRA
jgi:predicted outer membrane protein